MNSMPGSKSLAGCLAAPNHTSMDKLRERRCESINTFSCNGCLVAVFNLDGELHLMRLLQAAEILMH